MDFLFQSNEEFCICMGYKGIVWTIVVYAEKIILCGIRWVYACMALCIKGYRAFKDRHIPAVQLRGFNSETTEPSTAIHVCMSGVLLGAV